ncbi:hypothetical protein D6D17_03698 [Aureobasidium pullulans]|nr:hypothetical protein D6D17_03698 [Aureobasidium pullulans]THX95484.1 hypothetical protein D6D03_09210 [Aureobasidium pullulans]
MSQGKTEFFLVVSILQSCFVIFSDWSGGRQERSVHGHKASTSFVCQLAIELPICFSGNRLAEPS